MKIGTFIVYVHFTQPSGHKEVFDFPFVFTDMSYKISFAKHKLERWFKLMQTYIDMPLIHTWTHI